ncbi:MAG: PP2C family protein-serine/threonine phosphatase [Planctomycetota bacterium]|nr:PP2C family protein-serine/threonine phosphatase [Planctomycetota bacterium]
MHRVDLSNSATTALLHRMVKELSAASDFDGAFKTFMTLFPLARPLELFVGVAPVEGEPDAYRVTYVVDVRDLASGKPVPSRFAELGREQALPICRGGFVAEQIRDQEIKLVVELDLRSDPVLGDQARDLGSCFVIPTFHGSRVVEWAFCFSRPRQAAPIQAIESALMTANFMTMLNLQLTSLAEVQRLNTALVSEYEEIGRLQRALLPERLPSVPGLEFAASYMTSDRAGGDYYDFFTLPDGRLGILVADASGHGAAAATVMAMFHAIVHSFADHAARPHAMLEYANARLRHARLDGSFITAFFGVYDPGRRSLDYASAGHNPPRLWRFDGPPPSVESLDGAGSPPLGVLDSLGGASEVIELRAGDLLLLYTDGVTEAFSGRREQFGVHRLDAILAQAAGDPHRVVEAICQGVRQHTGAGAREDDQTLVAIALRK